VRLREGFGASVARDGLDRAFEPNGPKGFGLYFWDRIRRTEVRTMPTAEDFRRELFQMMANPPTKANSVHEPGCGAARDSIKQRVLRRVWIAKDGLPMGEKRPGSCRSVLSR
jgi:hypothetical protein